ncbi:MAG: NYN domain-containing protein [Candidatus Eremiobacteraeota bacterium]|nr:NYN domain-containing protein [Candidatus Eremiobacteraeota bacterium]MBV9646735.1 NYN domain-containing protein [Candidatus Eremiobacteraeota bacterium]
MNIERRLFGVERTAIFIDGWNFAKATYEGLGIRVDFKRLLSALSAGRLLVRAIYYIGEWSDEGYALMANLRRARVVDSGTAPPDPQESERRRMQQQGFIRMLNRNGYQVTKRPVVVFADGTTKALIGVDLALDMLSLADRCDRMVLVSGDGDFTPAVRAVAARGVRVQVVASQAPQAASATPEHARPFPARASDELLDAADEFTELKDLAAEIELQEPRRSPPRPFIPPEPPPAKEPASETEPSAERAVPDAP